ncbi:acyl-CoA synthetase (AMP-forming)/AMP-acid ligase II [Labedaea rhizosphaerae]|uniref:Acyl-CoA synthetase (AMP-forming)/AMP-acid ligase II n=1 Tax=Labedaea rhizosphaerae TaxID=598644 RepID=A0A4R6SK16_LABRH|nr:acyl-CoA synthetase (AMP-forming)/AMP-acid ligase II [Labedaea rhizosphaerae]
MVALASTFVHSLLDEAVAEAPDAVAVRDSVTAVTYRELAEASEAFAVWLDARGLRRGDRLVVQLPSRIELVALVHGCSRRGVILVPLNPAMKEFHIKSVLGNAEPAMVLTTGPALDVFSGLTDVPVHDMAEVWSLVQNLVGQRIPAPAELSVDDVAFLIYTSGSTAAPKAVICPHAQVSFASRSLQADLGYGPEDVVFCRFPLSWDYGLYKILLTALGRSEIVLAGEESDLVLLRRMRETGATIVPIVPSLAAMIAALAKRDSADLPPVRMFSNTGAALPEATIDALREAFPKAQVVRQFGQTECKRISIVPPQEDGLRPNSVGRPLQGTEVAILDPDGNEVPVGEVGEITVTGPHVMPGYWRNPEVTAKTFRQDRLGGNGLRLHTGDYGSVDADGYLYFEGRRDDMFKRKGIRISTVEIEAAAADIPGVRGACAVPPNGPRDLAIFAETELAPHDVIKELAKRLEPAKVPSICKVVDVMPLSLHGKNARKELAAMLDGAPA